MFDFTINDRGELVKEKDTLDILKASGEYLIRQLALVRIKSVTYDWFNHSDIGANLEDSIGKGEDDSVLADISSQIKQSIADIINQDNVFIASKIGSNNNLLIKVYLKIDEKTTTLIEVTLDTVGGVEVKYETNSQ